MPEDFLHYIWRYQYFNTPHLVTTNNIKLTVVNPGNWNEHAGPDFLTASIYFDDILFHGHVEIHTKGKDWQVHQHHKNKCYNNVILHVILEDECPAYRFDKTILPTLILKDFIEPNFLARYEAFIHQKQNEQPIICARYLPQLEEKVTLISMLDKTLFQKLYRKNHHIDQILHTTKNDWQKTSYQLLAQNFGFKVNKLPFYELSQQADFKIIQKIAHDLKLLEAFLFGRGGFLMCKANIQEEEIYFQTLKKEYEYLLHKYQLSREKELTLNKWNFLRLRPANSPTIRIAQFASLLHKSTNLFEDLTAINTVQEMYKQFNINVSPYWEKHYNFFKKSTSGIIALGKESIHNIAINTVVPLCIAYGKFKNDDMYINKAMQLLESMKPENNQIIRRWKQLNIIPKNAFDSQALIELYNEFCIKTKCLSCSIGVSILNKDKMKKKKR